MGNARATQGSRNESSDSPLGVRDAGGCGGGAALVALRPVSRDMREVGGPFGAGGRARARAAALACCVAAIGVRD